MRIIKVRCAAVLVVTLVAGGHGTAFEPALTGEVLIAGPATARVDKRMARDLPIRRDMTAVKSFRFDMRISDTADFSSYVCYFKSGGGWYKVSLELPEDAVPGGWYPITVTAKNAEAEGKPDGWKNVEAVRIAGYRSTTNAVSLTLRNVGFDVSKPEAYVVQGRGGKNDDGSRHASIFVQALEKIGVDVRQVSESDVVPGIFDGAAFVVLPFNPQMKPEACAEVEAFVKKGGKLFACYGQQQPIMDLLSVAVNGVAYRPLDRREGDLLGFAKTGKGLPGQPDFLAQASWMCRVVKPLAGADVAAFWRTQDGKTTDMPGLVVSPNGAYLSHVWLNPGSAESSAFLAAVVDRLLPGVRARFEAHRSAACAEEERMLATTRAMPSRAGERRLIWCHSAWGLGGTNDWNTTCRFLKTNGFTDLVVNLVWGGYAFYPSKVLPQAEAARGDALAQCQAACRKHGIRMHVWKVCWKMGRAVSPAFVQAAKDAGRMQRTSQGEFDDLWNCPSDPHNQQLEIDAMVELALEKKVDGVHFDYIRYPGSSCCFCDSCRRRFEAFLGRPVANWPKDVQADGAVASAWRSFRCANISHVVKTVHDRVRAAGSGVEISAAVFRDPGRDPETVGQDWVRWCAEGWLDFVCPMDYMTSPSRYAERIRLQNTALRAAGSKAKFYPGMAVMCSHFNQPLTPLVIAQEIAAVRAEGLEGFTLFSLSRLAERVLPVLREGPLSAD